MKKIALIAACLALTAIVPAVAQTEPPAMVLTCGDWKHNGDGSWAPAHDVTLHFPNGVVILGPTAVFPERGTYMGYPLAIFLDKQCAAH